MRIEDGTYSSATFFSGSIILFVISTILNLTLSILFGWGFMFLFFAEGFIWFLTLVAHHDHDMTVTDIDFWEEGYKRKFKMWQGSEGKTYVETKVGFFWVPLWEAYVSETETRYDTKTGEEKLINHYDFRIMTFDSTTIAQEYIHKERGIASATLEGEFEA